MYQAWRSFTYRQGHGILRITPGSIVADIGCGACATIDHLSEAYKIKAFGLDPIMNIPGPPGIVLSGALRRDAFQGHRI